MPTDVLLGYMQATDTLRYVWVVLSHDYDCIEVLGVYATLEKAKAPYVVGWKEEVFKNGTLCYYRKWGDSEWQRDVIVRYEVSL